MSHIMEDDKQRTFAVDDAQAFAIGDMLFHDTNDVKEAGQFTWDTSLAVTQRAFSKLFAGVAKDRKVASDGSLEKAVARAGICEFTCASATFEVGDLVGPAKASGNALEPQKVVAVAGVDLAIGKVAQRYSSSTTTVRVEIFPKATSDTMRSEDIVRELEQATTKLSADAIQDGTTNKAYTAAEKTKLANTPTVFFISHVVTAGQASANVANISTGLGEPASFYVVQIYRLGAIVTGDAVIANNSGSIAVGDGATYTLTENDVVNVLAMKY